MNMKTSVQRVIPISLGMVKVFLIRGQSRSVLIDAGNVPGDGDKIIAQIQAHGVDPRSISLIVITHIHRDHVGALSQLVAATGAPVVVHAAEADLLRRGTSQVVVPRTWPAKLVMRLAPPTPLPAVEPNLIVQEELDLTPFGVAGQVLSTPGHTDGSLSVRLSGGEAIVGDLIMSWLMSTRIPTWPMIAQNPAQVAESIKRVLAWHPTLIYAAHGGPFTAQAVAKRLKIEMPGS